MVYGIEDVVAGGLCVGCGACSVATSGAIPITIGRRQSFEASLAGVSEPDLRRASGVCPFSDESENEDRIAARVLPPGTPTDERIGGYRQIAAARVTDSGWLLGSSSGGLTSWTAVKLLERGDVQGIIHVRPDVTGDGLFSYQVSHSVEAFRSHRKSMYYSTSFADALQAIRGDGRRYAFIGVPCFIRAARLLCDADEPLRNQLAFFLGLVCGHLKSFGFAESLAWQVGVDPARLGAVDFRVKVPGRSSSSYDFGARARGAHELITRSTGSLVGGSWGHGAFQLNACNYCDDIFAETADVAFGDAWLPQYKEDWRGTNVVITRNPVIDAILHRGVAAGELTLESLTIDEVAASQAGNFRHRRDGLSVRLADDVALGVPIPRKRVGPGSRPVSRARVRMIRTRREMSARSQELFSEAKSPQSLQFYLDGMTTLIAQYRRAEMRALPLWRQAARVAHRALRRRTRSPGNW